MIWFAAKIGAAHAAKDAMRPDARHRTGAAPSRSTGSLAPVYFVIDFVAPQGGATAP